MSSAKIEIAVVGRFQLGKSSLVNCLLGRSVAKIGNGYISETPNCSDPNDPNYVLGCDVVIIDTPGVDDKSDRDEEAEKAIQSAQCVLFVKDNERQCGLLETRWIDLIREKRKPCVFVLNCMRGGQRSHWSPDSEYNATFCREIYDGFVLKNQVEDIFLPIGGRPVLPINVCWAQFGLGLLEDIEKSREIEELFRDQLKIRDELLRSEAVKRSNIGVLIDFIGNIRLELLTHFLRNKDQVVQRITEDFFREFTKRLAARGAA